MARLAAARADRARRVLAGCVMALRAGARRRAAAPGRDLRLLGVHPGRRGLGARRDAAAAAGCARARHLRSGDPGRVRPGGAGPAARPGRGGALQGVPTSPHARSGVPRRRPATGSNAPGGGWAFAGVIGFLGLAGGGTYGATFKRFSRAFGVDGLSGLLPRHARPDRRARARLLVALPGADRRGARRPAR